MLRRDGRSRAGGPHWRRRRRRLLLLLLKLLLILLILLMPLQLNKLVLRRPFGPLHGRE